MTQTPKDLDPGRSAKHLFGAELRHWRELRELSQADLAKGTHFTPHLICKVEKADRWPTRELAEACDKALDTGGALCRLWPWVETEHAAGEQARAQARAAARADGPATQETPAETPRDAAQEAPVPAGTLVPRRAVPAHTGRRGTTDATTRRPRSGAHRGQVGPRPRWRRGGRPVSLEDQLVMSAHRSADQEDHFSNVGPATLDQLRTDTTALARSFANAPRHAVFSRAELLRERVFELLDGRQRLAESRELFFLAGAACGMLANITSNHGLHDSALAHTRLALLCAKEAGHAGLVAWIRGEQSEISYFAGRPGQAADYARRGQEHASTGSAGSVAVWLPALEARATGRLGDRERTRTALARAARARESARRDDLDDIGGILAFNRPKQHFYAAESYLDIGDPQSVVTEADACVAGYREGPEEDHAYDNEASTLVTLAAAYTMEGDLDGAREALRPVFDLPPDLRIDPLDTRLRRLHRRLTAQRVRTAPLAAQLRDEIETHLATGPAALPGE